MPTKHEYKAALKRLDTDTRICLLYLEGLIETRFKTALAAQQPPAPKADLSKIESQLDSLQKQFNGLRPKILAGYRLSQEHDEQEKYLERLTKTAEIALDDMKKYFEERYKSGHFSEGTRRKIRAEGLIDLRKEVQLT